MHGTAILARTLTVPAALDKAFKANRWQYHSRSDRHSKVACWGILFDMLATSPVLAGHVAAGRIGFGINHEMRDFRVDRKKNLDLVLCSPGTSTGHGRLTTLRALVARWGIVLSPAERALLDRLADIPEVPVGSVYVALEAKACMTAHIKALPRLYDELNSSHQTIHGNVDHAVAVGFAMVNGASTFVSSDRNKWDLATHPAAVSLHNQPAHAQRAVDKLKQLPRRSATGQDGFDALGIVVVDCPNDGTPFGVSDQPPAPPIGDSFHYDTMIRRASQVLETRFPLR